ncbi:hypothetical protein S83_068715 [Arachis hypogaea]|nr:Telomeric repeat-binding factor [Arachis hypogaea]
MSSLACQKGNPQLQRKVHAFLRCDKGVKVSIAEELGRENSGSENATELSAGVKIAQESLKSSFSELQPCVKDPLPEALNIFDIGSKLALKSTNQEQPIQNKGGDVDVSNSNTCRDIVLFQTKDVDHKKSSIQRPNLIEENNPAHESPNLMEQNSTAHSYERDDSKDNFPTGVQLRRKKRKWSPLEEDTLRTGVKEFGVGCWTTIQSSYKNIFETVHQAP